MKLLHENYNPIKCHLWNKMFKSGRSVLKSIFILCNFAEFAIIFSAKLYEINFQQLLVSEQDSYLKMSENKLQGLESLDGLFRSEVNRGWKQNLFLADWTFPKVRFSRLAIDFPE